MLNVSGLSPVEDVTVGHGLLLAAPAPAPEEPAPARAVHPVLERLVLQPISSSAFIGAAFGGTMIGLGVLRVFIDPIMGIFNLGIGIATCLQMRNAFPDLKLLGKISAISGAMSLVYSCFLLTLFGPTALPVFAITASLVAIASVLIFKNHMIIQQVPLRA